MNCENTYTLAKSNKKTRKTYQPKGKKPYQKWIDEHKEDILKQESKNRVDYVFQKMNKELNLNMSIKSIYQLLYRNDLIDHKKITQQKNDEDVEIIKTKSIIDSLIVNNTNENINEYEKFDNFEFGQPMKDHISPAIQFTTEHLIHYLGQSSLIMCCLIPNVENVEDEFKPIVMKFIQSLLSLNSEIDNLKKYSEEMKKVNLSCCEDVIVKFIKDNEVETHLTKNNDLTKIYSLSK